MLKTTERLNLILTLNKYNLGLGLLADFDMETILNFCAGLEEQKIPCTWYAGHPEIQKELISDERFFFYLDKLIEFITSVATINAFLKILHDNGETALDYPIHCLLNSMIVTTDDIDVFYDYIKNFGIINDIEKQKIIVENLGLYNKLLSKPVTEVSESEKYFFMKPFLMKKNLIPDNIDRVLTMLAHQTGLSFLIEFFYENDINVNLSIENYESFCVNPPEIHVKLKTLYEQLGKDNMTYLMKRWLENNCPYYDLEILCKTLKDLDGERLEDVLYSRSGYINLIYGSKINNISLSEIPNYKEDI